MLLFAFTGPLASNSGEGFFTAHTVDVLDGDSLTVRTRDGSTLELRLADVDSPELSQPWGDRTRQALSKLVHGRPVTVQPLKTDRYGRTIARVDVGAGNVSRALVAAGYAWVYRQYSDDPELLALEQTARQQRRGLWSLPDSDQVPPWDWRHQEASAAAAGVWTGKVIGVSDGDSLTVLAAGNRQVKVRLASVDAPEKAQPWGKNAKQALSLLVHGRQVTVEALKLDKYRRTVAHVEVDGQDVGRALLTGGHVWVFRKYDDSPELLDLEAQARARRRGLWSLPPAQRQPPWKWRDQRRAARTTAGPRPPGCGAKRRCSEMRDCAEAKFYLRTCGVASLDGDGDGVPCQALCR